jgi:2-polyprenyl-6-methoxyphenol hydroxylase-like FAD-dependent oxidoreductase
LFVFTGCEGSARTDPEGQKALLRARYGDGQWECPRILDELNHAQDLYFDRVSQIRMNTWSKGRVASVGDAAFFVSLMAGQGSALGMTAAYVLAGELAKAQGRQDEAFRTTRLSCEASSLPSKAARRIFPPPLCQRPGWACAFAIK